MPRTVEDRLLLFRGGPQDGRSDRQAELFPDNPTGPVPDFISFASLVTEGIFHRYRKFDRTSLSGVTVIRFEYDRRIDKRGLKPEGKPC